ncbi:MAG: fibronectin type III domain-containing protein [Ignavibacteria bacterium]|nr:fibronectin type III domain-containing protein [Ignavibacteria bacterium]
MISASATRLFLCISILLLLSTCRREIPLESTDDTNSPASPTLILDDTSATGAYTVHWTAPAGATSYVLQEDQSDDFRNAVVAYSGSNTFLEVSGKSSGKTYYYRVIATSEAGESAWSKTKSIAVI